MHFPPLLPTLYRVAFLLSFATVNPEKSFVKRVIGLGDDKIQIVDREFHINDQLIPATQTDVSEDDDQPYSKAIGPPTIYDERIGDLSYRVQYLRDKSAINAGPWLVPEDGVFVIGGNRDNSQDSRATQTRYLLSPPSTTFSSKRFNAFSNDLSPRTKFFNFDDPFTDRHHAPFSCSWQPERYVRNRCRSFSSKTSPGSE